MKIDGLTPKQRVFCKEYLANGYNARQAALAAGYSANCACQAVTKLFASPSVKKFLKKRMNQVEKKLDITFEKKAALLWAAAQRCFGPSEDDVGKMKLGEPIKAFFEFQPQALVSSIAELNKMQGHHAPQKSESKIDDEQFKQLVKECEKEY